jgi:O-antigen/teichoic acid export membrane protein
MTRPSDNPAASGGFLFNVNLVFIATVCSYGFGLATAILLARALGPEGRGVTALYQAAVSLGFAFLSLGIATAAVYYVGRRDISGRQAMEAGLSVTLMATALTAVGVAIAAVAFGEDLAGEDVPYWLMLVAIPALVQFRSAEAVLRAQGRFGAMNLLEVSLPLSILACLGAVELADGLTIYSAVVAWTLAFLPPVALAYVLLGPSQWPRGLAGRDLLWQATRFGMQGQLSNLIQLLNYRLDSYLVLLLVNTRGVGLYAVGVSLSEGMWFIANSVSVVLLTNLTAGDEENAARMTPIVCRNTLLVTAAASLAAAAVSPFAIPLIFRDEFADAVLPFLWLLPGTVALAGTKILAAFVFSRGRPLINAQIAFVTLVVTVVADLILIPPFEVAGAAAASSLAYGCSLALSAVAWRRISGGTITDVLLPRLSDAPYYVDGLHSLLGRLRRGEAQT